MIRKLALLCACGLLYVVTSPKVVYAYDDCADVCVGGDQCNGSLQCQDGSRVRDCYSYSYDLGYCHSSGGCTSYDPDWHFTPSSWIGGWEVDPLGGGCEYWVAYTGTWHDNNSACTNNQDNSGCFQEQAGSGANPGACCLYYTCFGSSC